MAEASDRIAVTGAPTGAEKPASVGGLDRLFPSEPLTGLPGRQALARHLRQMLADPDRRQDAGAVIAINLDNFRAVNALHGAATGDQVLCVTAERLRSAVRAIDFAARLGADEFAVIAAAPASSADE